MTSGLRLAALSLGLSATAVACAGGAQHEERSSTASRPDVATVVAREAPAPVYARYRVTVALPTKPAQHVRQVWHFHRDADEVALLKGSIDETWRRDRHGLVGLTRVFHDDRRAVDYSPGELATLGVTTDWTTLSSFVDPRVLQDLRVASRRGTGTVEPMMLEGRSGGDAYRITWNRALQLPARMLRTERDGRRTELVLERHAATRPADWPDAEARSADYLRLDAADFGDMAYEPVVRKAEALDVRLGWRTPHSHD